MKAIIKKRVQAIRLSLINKGCSATIIPSTDPHISEYVAPHWKAREWISGFDGSAGTVVVTTKKAGLWTDSRYFIQADQQLADTTIELYKEGLPNTPTICDFLRKELPNGSTVAIDGSVFSYSEVNRIRQQLASHDIELQTTIDPVALSWEDRPALPINPPFIQPTSYAGSSCKEKMGLLKERMSELNAESMLVTALDEIAWLLNLRGSDVSYNPVVVCYFLLTPKRAQLFMDPIKMTKEIHDYLCANNIEVEKYSSLYETVCTLESKSILVDPAKTNYAAYSAIPKTTQIVEAPSPIALLKAIKNSTEIAGVKQAMIKDGVALVQFLRFLAQEIPTNKQTELTIDTQLTAFRAQQPLYHGQSFGTIAGYGDHGAIVHYSATPASAYTLKAENFLLLDSGAQYYDGTTDITRTIPLGDKLTTQQQIDYTLVLKGHIKLAMAKFPAGTRGSQLDVLARISMWERGINFLHGTGHGIGHFLNVHEGPQSIRMDENPTKLCPGMMLSNEPGIYRKDQYGIRIENLILVVNHQTTDMGDYYGFETLTLCPISIQPIVADLLTETEINWLNEYHANVYQKLAPHLDREECEWLKEHTGAI